MKKRLAVLCLSILSATAAYAEESDKAEFTRPVPVTPTVTAPEQGMGMEANEKRLNRFSTATPVPVKNEKDLDILDSKLAAPIPLAVVKTSVKKPAAESSGADFDVALNSNKSIKVSLGDNVIIPISRNHVNRLVTPFAHAQVISTSLSGGNKTDCGELCVRGQVVYVSTDKAEPVTAFISERDHEDIAISVTMIPRNIPPREVRFSLPEEVNDVLKKSGSFAGVMGRVSSAGTLKAEAWETSQPFVDVLRDGFRLIALGQVPQGYSLRSLKDSEEVPVCQHPGLKVSFKDGQVLEGANLSFYVGVLENVSKDVVEFDESNCGGWRIAAVSSWPLHVLKPGQKTEVYFAVKADEQPEQEVQRTPLIPREFN